MYRSLLTLCTLALLAAPALALADDRRCAHSDARDLALDLAGVKTVMFQIGHNELRVDATTAARPAVTGRACASGANLLGQLTLDQHREGDKLVVRATREGRGIWVGNQYAYMALQASVPADVMVQLDVGSGDAWVTGASALSADVGSGDVEARNIRGHVTAKVGSGDIELREIGSLHVLSIGSGDVEAYNVRGNVEVGSIGSGDFTLKGAGGHVQIGSIGSGDADVERVSGNVTVGSIGSGDLDVEDVTGNLTVRSKGSGSIDHSRVSGTIDIPRRR
ncbi:hypothetical protein E2F46_13590 [Luteimonas aestuarii]|uniref:DUF4097 domain-containing protein n=1 Tax=Luteimonas aestuarii TaxID=453837 RepID=A0A4R5TKG7_9GAMM|nr:DUF4097 family beta strand repeat-containing protein [Luteimonas aestuarii]TDK22492.1 hypothetical protein E2F46_13590 [Luteimonas aestuarii]